MNRWVCVDKEGNEYMHSTKPDMKNSLFWYCDYKSIGECVSLPKGSIEKLLGYKLHYQNIPAFITDIQPLTD